MKPGRGAGRQAWVAASAIAVVALAAGFGRTCVDRESLAPQKLAIDPGLRATRVADSSRKGLDRGVRSVFLLGDSTAMSPGRPHDRLAVRLQAALDARSSQATLRVRAIMEAGLEVYSFYCLADELARGRPAVVVLPINLQMIRPAVPVVSRRPGLGGWIAARRYPGAMRLPLQRIGLTLDRLLLYAALRRTNGGAPWVWTRTEQARAFHAWTQLAVDSGNEARDGREARSWRVTSPDFDAGVAHKIYPDAIRGIAATHPDLEMLTATLADLARLDVPTLVYVVPLNHEQLARVVPEARAGLARSTGAIGDVARSQGAHFADLHDLLPHEAFVDATHFHEGPESAGGQVAVAARLARAVSAMAAR